MATSNADEEIFPEHGLHAVSLGHFPQGVPMGRGVVPLSPVAMPTARRSTWFTWIPHPSPGSIFGEKSNSISISGQGFRAEQS